MKKILITLFSFCFIISFLILIIPERIGYGVVLWDKEAPQNNGRLVKIKQESKLRKLYIVQIEGERVEYKTGQLHFEKRKRKAAQFQENFLPYADYFAYAKRDRHSVRVEADAFSSIVYTLREGEIVKILGRTDEKVTIGSTQDYWYYILTENGAIGYSYGHNLQIYHGDNAQKINPHQISVENLAATKFYPIEYKQYIDNGTYDLELFNRNDHFQLNSEEKTISIHCHKYSQVFAYTEIKSDRKLLTFEGTPIQVNISNPNEILVINSSVKNDYGQYFCPIEELPAIIEEEQIRQNSLFEEFIAEGNRFSSLSAGRLTIEGNRQFQWTQNRVLVPDYLPSEDFQNGTLSFNLFADADLAAGYRGAVIFQFEQGKRVYALYNLDSSHLELTLLPDYLVENCRVAREPTDPVKLYLSR